MARVNIHDVAAAAGVSVGTVSRALNGRGEVNEATRARVVGAARELGYTPNPAGRNLSRGASGVVAIVVDVGPEFGSVGDPFVLSLVMSLQSRLADADVDLSVLLVPPGDDPLRRLRRVVEAGSADAVVLTEILERDDRVSYLIDAAFPFVTFGRSTIEPHRYSSLDLDFAAAAQLATERLWNAGHRRFAVVAPATELTYAHEWIRGVESALESREADLEVVREGLDERGGARAVVRLQQGGGSPSAYLIANEHMALGAFQALHDSGADIGGGTSVVVASDSPVLRTLRPAVTGFRAPTAELGRRLGDFVLASTPRYAIDGVTAVQHALMPLEIVVRDSAL
jgi:DNA-binding LacI/PurR family transcriptional regulator